MQAGRACRSGGENPGFRWSTAGGHVAPLCYAMLHFRCTRYAMLCFVSAAPPMLCYASFPLHPLCYAMLIFRCTPYAMLCFVPAAPPMLCYASFPLHHPLLQRAEGGEDACMYMYMYLYMYRWGMLYVGRGTDGGMLNMEKVPVGD